MNLKDYARNQYDQPFTEEHFIAPRINRVLELIGTGNDVLDIGCWDGTISEKIRAYGNKVIGVDISPGAVKRARTKIHAVIGDVEKGLIGFKDNSFDVIFMGDIIEHLFDTKKVLREVHRLLKPGGKFVITTINICSLRERVLVLAGHLPSHYGVHEDHIRLFNKQKFERLLSEQFKIESFEGWRVELPITPLTYNGLTTNFVSLANHFIVKCRKEVN